MLLSGHSIKLLLIMTYANGLLIDQWISHPSSGKFLFCNMINTYSQGVENERLQKSQP